MSDDEWYPSEEDVDEDAEAEEEIQAEEDDEDEAFELGEDLGGVIDPFSLLERMGEQETGTDALTVKQPFEVLAEQARAQQAAAESSDEEAAGPSKEKKKGKKKGKGGFGATVDDIWDEDMAADLGMDIGLSTKGRRRQRARQKRRRKALAEGKKTKQLPEEVTAKMGQANLSYVTGKYDEAIRLLKEVVKLAPHLQDAYFTLGQVYEAAGNKRQALDLYMIAAHLTPKDVDLWRRLALLSSELNFHRQTIYCLSKVIIRDTNDLPSRWERARLYMDLGELKRALPEFEKINDMYSGNPEAPKMLAHLYHQLGQPGKAIQALETHLREHQLATDFTHANLLAELYMEDRRFPKAFKLIQNTIEVYCKPDNIPLDFQVKASICLLHMSDMEGARPGLRALEDVDLDESFADLYMDAANALLENHHPEEASKLFLELHEKGLGGGEVWMKIASCYKQQDNLEGAVSIYKNVLADEGLPVGTRTTAALALAELHEQHGQEEEARDALRMLDELGHLELDVLNRKTELLLKLGDQDGYLDVMMPLLDAALKHAAGPKGGRKPGMGHQARRRKQVIARQKNREEQSAVFKGYVTRDRRKPHVIEADARLAEEMEEEAEKSGEEEPSEQPVLFQNVSKDDAQFAALMKTAQVLMEAGKPLQASELLAECLSRLTKRSTDKSRKDALRVLAAEAALAAGEPALALFHLRFACESCPYSIPIWNMFCEAATDLGSLKQAQKAASLLRHTIDCVPLKLVHGHCLSLNNAHGRAVAEYMSAYNSDPNNPLILLCIGVSHLNQAVSRKVPDRDRAVLAAFAFLQKYARMRENKQEVYYNLGRAAHQIGLLHLAVPLYQRALAAEVPPALEPKNRVRKSLPQIDLSREIAHNLVLIYRASGADNLARALMKRYLTIR